MGTEWGTRSTVLWLCGTMWLPCLNNSAGPAENWNWPLGDKQKVYLAHLIGRIVCWGGTLFSGTEWGSNLQGGHLGPSWFYPVSRKNIILSLNVRSHAIPSLIHKKPYLCAVFDCIPRKGNQQSCSNSLFSLLHPPLTFSVVCQLPNLTIVGKKKHYEIHYQEVICKMFYTLRKKNTKHDFTYHRCRGHF